MATTTKHEVGTWDTFHHNGPFPTKVQYNTSLEGKGNMPSLIDHNDAAAEMQRLLKTTSMPAKASAPSDRVGR